MVLPGIAMQGISGLAQALIFASRDPLAWNEGDSDLAGALTYIVGKADPT